MKAGDRQIHLLVRFRDQVCEEVRLSAQARPKRLMESVVERGVLPPRGGRVLLRRQTDGSIVPPNKRLMDIGIADGETLVVEPVEK